MWSDEIVAAYKSNLVMANLVTRLSHVGKKGDAIHIPKPTRRSASAKATDTIVTLVDSGSTSGGSHGVVNLYIDKHYEYSTLIEDMAAVQALESMRRFYTDDAGYALASQVDTDLLDLAQGAQGGTAGSADYDAAILGGDGSTTYVDGTNVGTALTDAGVRNLIQLLDDQDTPMDNRYLVLPPVERNNLMGIPRFTEQAFVGEQGAGNTIRSGNVGEIYGIPVYITTNCRSATTTTTKIGLMFHKEWSTLIEQMTVRVQTDYMQQYLATLMTADTIYGVGEVRDASCIAIAVAA
jgi:hypothetical protein